MLIRMLNVFPFGYVNIQNVSAKSFGIPGYRVVPKNDCRIANKIACLISLRSSYSPQREKVI